MKKGKLFVLSAPSGAGKTTLKDGLLDAFPKLSYSISATTRPKREGEVQGEHYYFYTRPEFEKLISEGAFIEYNEVHGNLYGTLKKTVYDKQSEGISLVFDLDVYGKINFDKVFPEAIGILIKPTSIEVLRERLIKRGTDAPETIELRIKNAVKELDFALSKGKYEYSVVNKDLLTAQKELEDIIRLEMNK